MDHWGRFLREVVEVPGPASVHILNYNSPGATGAPAYTAHLLDRLKSQGHLDHLRPGSQPAEALWDYEKAIAGF